MADFTKFITRQPRTNLEPEQRDAILKQFSKEGVVKDKYVHMSFSSVDGMEVARFRDQITKAPGYDNTDLVAPTTADSGWLVDWKTQLNGANTAVVVILYTDSYREKLPHSNAPLRKEAHTILAAKKAKPALKIYVLDPREPNQGCSSVRALLADDTPETNFIGYKKWLSGQGVHTDRASTSDSIATKVFDLIDTNDNGKLSKLEVFEFCQAHKLNVSKFNRKLNISDSHHMERGAFVAAYDRGDLEMIDFIDFPTSLFLQQVLACAHAHGFISLKSKHQVEKMVATYSHSRHCSK